MKLLREYIGRVLQEGMKTHSELPAGVHILIRDTGRSISIAYSDENGDEFDEFSRSPVKGFVTASKTHTGAYQVGYAMNLASPGWGPLLYDLMIEYVTQKGSSLVPSESQSADAIRLWTYYDDHRVRRPGNDQGDIDKTPHGYTKTPNTVSTLDSKGMIHRSSSN
jgi:hypothetical protein